MSKGYSNEQSWESSCDFCGPSEITRRENRYPAGATFPIHYEPDHPEQSVVALGVKNFDPYGEGSVFLLFLVTIFSVIGAFFYFGLAYADHLLNCDEAMGHGG